MSAAITRRLCAGLRAAIALNDAAGERCDPATLAHLALVERFAAGEPVDLFAVLDRAESVSRAWSEDAERGGFHARRETAEAVWSLAAFAADADDSLEDTLERIERLVTRHELPFDTRGRMQRVAGVMGCGLTSDGAFDTKSFENRRRVPVRGAR